MHSRRTTVSVSSLSVVVLAAVALAVAGVAVAADRPVDGLLDRVLDRCSLGPGAVGCLKGNVLEFLRDGRAADVEADGDVDAELVRAAGAYIERRVNEPNVAAPVRDARAMDNDAGPAASAAAAASATTTTTARADMEMGMMQDKMLMPLMMMMKMKLKMLMPIMMALVSMKATKALVLSKVAIMLVLGFLLKEFLKKSGIPGLPLHLPGFPGSAEPSSTSGPPPMYGPPQSSGYESSSSWEPTGYSSHSSDSAHSMAYNSYQPSPSSSSSGSSASLSSNKY
ncbi:osiris 20-like precursor [Acyrthosiphon pisum]|uniref:ACYPI007146 protein n=1 Tax=Acyrthosiphon pisum TaxID=7029 RepID=C4WWV3_ACYPI|nr:osiris 20-like precursor [Acyrthosiphon pisum]BAH72373.1 ACYPI007146 [Acyrthosiphon pisum]|eukprot:NP_001155697.1 osiris 20-like precursor [Acyrthosiphon pisum]